MAQRCADSPRVSVVVPVYNVERFIRRTVGSLTAQDYGDLEIVLVDDGSPDDSPAILDKLAASDPRVRVVHQENRGVSAARNVGIAASSGEWIMFVDGDDWVEPDYVSYFVDLVHSLGCDVGVGVGCFAADGRVISSGSSRREGVEWAIEQIYTGGVNVAVWNKIYRAGLLRGSGVAFNEDVWYGEGMLFNVEVLQHVDRVAVGGRAVYHQVYNPNSAMRSFSLESNLCGIHSMELQRKAWVRSTPALERAWQYHRYCFNRSIAGGLAQVGAVEAHRDLFDECARNIRRGILIPLRYERSPRKVAGWLAWALFPAFMASRGARRHRRDAEAADKRER